jgi:hypothetical protein
VADTLKSRAIDGEIIDQGRTVSLGARLFPLTRLPLSLNGVFRSFRRIHNRSVSQRNKKSFAAKRSFPKALFEKQLRVKTEFQFAAFGRKLSLPAHLLIRGLESAQTPHFFHNTLGV